MHLCYGGCRHDGVFAACVGVDGLDSAARATWKVVLWHGMVFLPTHVEQKFFNPIFKNYCSGTFENLISNTGKVYEYSDVCKITRAILVFQI